MSKIRHPTRCAICGKSFPRRTLYPIAAIRPKVLQEIEAEKPQIDHSAYICKEDLAAARIRYVQRLLISEKGELSGLEVGVLESMADDDVLAADLREDFIEQLTFGQRLADKIATFGGSWTFLISFFSFLLIWIGINTVVLLTRSFDPFPFILLNLLLSCIAAIQAPVIMMSQNRQEAKDRILGEHEYQINLKAELEIRHLHEKVDHLMKQQWERLVEIQQVQIELLQELSYRAGRSRDDE
ncbi:DUF1003 domain-containing protein [Akkermansiaceae bacterium]|nr:DUF1003 domain-containing protein [Akkermansiaceae bacterium]MDA7934360.1 DUF1003 domain-containing protein [Akkermansiaceae bacterium]MDB4466316.1 DUF1003 domain-containing protein [bacterium]